MARVYFNNPVEDTSIKQHSITDFLFDEEASIPKSKLLIVGSLMVILAVTLGVQDALAGHRSHRSHRSSRTGHSSHYSHSSHRSGSHSSHSNHSNHSSHSNHASHSNRAGAQLPSTQAKTPKPTATPKPTPTPEPTFVPHSKIKTPLIPPDTFPLE